MKRRSNSQPMAIEKNGFLKSIRNVASWWDVYILLLPAIIVTFIFAYIPMYGVQIAFKDFSAKAGIWGSQWVGLKHFQRFLTYPMFWRIVRNTLLISLYSLATFPLPVIFALLLNEIRYTKFKKTVQMISYAPHFISEVVLCGMIILFLNRNYGVINHFLELIVITSIDFLSNPNYFRSIYVWSGVWQGLGWGSIIYLAALSGVSPELIEAAKIDGASRLRIIRSINIPQILPTIGILLIMRSGSLLNVGFTKIMLLQNSLNLDVSQVIASYTYEVGIAGGQFSYSSAIGLTNNIVNLLMLILVNSITKKATSIGLF